jgi:hypothetical protein
MKKCWIIIIFIMFLFFPMPAQAEKMLIKVMDNFSSQTPQIEYSFILPEAIHLKHKRIIEKGSVINGQISEIIEPKRLKKDAYFVFIADTYTVPSDNGKKVKIIKKMESKIKYYEDFEMPDTKTIAENTGITVAGILVPGLDMGINFVKGVSKPNEDENRFHSGCRHIVESWPLCYCLKGNEIAIPAGSMAIFDFDKEMFEQ